MNCYELAARLNEREYGEEITPDECAQAKRDGLVVVFGYSDDNIELRGAIEDEIGAYDGGKIYFDASGLLHNDCGNDECPYFEMRKETAKSIEALWCKGAWNWSYKTDIIHATFDIMEDGGQFCKGIVFYIGALR